MGIQTMGSQTSGQALHLRTSPLTRQGSWYNLTLEEVRSQLGGLGKPLGSMNLDELLKNVLAAERNQGMEGMVNGNGWGGGDGGGIPISPLQRQASLTLAKAFSGKTVDEVWREIQQGQRRCDTEASAPRREQTLEEITLEDFLVQAGLLTDTSLSSSQGSETNVPQMPQAGVVATSAEKLLVSSSYRRKRDDPDAHDRSLERRLKRKIKNRESAARSRARKQAYRNELVTKVSQLEEQNMKLKKEKEFDSKFPGEAPVDTKYQIRRTSSASLLPYARNTHHLRDRTEDLTSFR